MTDEDFAVFRILDANLNRASEGLRVAEEHARFVLNDSHLTSMAKGLRHQLAELAAGLDVDGRLACRNATGDVGLQVTTESESQRDSTAAVGVAAVKRAQQALRCIEEYGKRISSSAAAQCEQLRYATYTLEQTLHTATQMQQTFSGRQLYVLIDKGSSEPEFEDLVRCLVAAEVGVLQLRDKQATDRELLGRARTLCRLTRGTGTLAIVNDRPDIARLAGADGVHVGQDELSVSDVRQIVGPRMLIGVSTHTIEQAREAVVQGANYIGCGPTFPSGTKHFEQFSGLEFLQQVAAEIRLPAFAIGGITADNLPQVLACGVERVAVSGAVIRADSPGSAAGALQVQLRAVADADSPRR
ncbi:MAG: thiamine phosphate synthase [Blastopirellula sp.]|nr:thiamine phosphate synthase [Blastopirellula sp.]